MPILIHSRNVAYIISLLGRHHLEYRKTNFHPVLTNSSHFPIKENRSGKATNRLCFLLTENSKKFVGVSKVRSAGIDHTLQKL